MRDYQLGFISNEDIFDHVKNTVQEYRASINLKEFNSNLVDAIKLTFDAKVYGKSYEEIISAECIRQMDKTNSNTIGYFHQNLFKYAGQGWEVPSEGFDIINNERHLYVELKNKHNTMNAASSKNTYIKMQNTILSDDACICMLVEVIAKHSQNKKWDITINDKKYSHERIRRVSMDLFYGIVFDDTQAFAKLCYALPVILDDVIADLGTSFYNNTVYDELHGISHDTLKSLFLLSFKTYEGFNQQ